MEKEKYWSRFAFDFEEKNRYVVGENNEQIVFSHLALEKNLGKVLELACGNGTFTEIIEKNAEFINATDYSEEMVKETEKRFEENKKIKVTKENCFDLSYEDEVFDTIFMANLIHVIPNPHLALGEARRVLKKEGKLIIFSYTKEGLSEEEEKLANRYKNTYGKPPKEAYRLTKDLAKSLVLDEKFEIEKLDLIGEDVKGVYLVGKK